MQIVFEHSDLLWFNMKLTFKLQPELLSEMPLQKFCIELKLPTSQNLNSTVV